MADEEKVASGVFIDTKTNKVVHEKPEEGVQIVPEGGVFDGLAKGILAAEGLEVASAAEKVETADDPEKTVKSVTPKTAKKDDE